MSVQSAYENSFNTDLFPSSDVWAGLERSLCLGPPSLLTSEDTTGAPFDWLLLRTSGPPQRIGPYRLLAEIGHGGMGAVFRVIRDDAPDQEHALKIIRPGLNRHLLLHRFLREMQILRTLRHPYLARVLDWVLLRTENPSSSWIS